MAVNYSILRIELDKQSDIIFKKVQPIIEKKFDRDKRDMLKVFDNDKVTKEIKAGPNATSSFLYTAADSENATGGNLFSFLGFTRGAKPIQELRDILNKNIILKISGKKKKITQNAIIYEVPVTIPTKNDLDSQIQENPVWTSRNWVDLIENGIPWFSHYLFDNTRNFNNSESTTAIQIKQSMSQGRGYSGGVKYLSEILANFKKSISGK